MSEVEQMLILVKKYGLSHVCALQEFTDMPNALWSRPNPYGLRAKLMAESNFPFLDIYLSNTSGFNSIIEFYYRGTKDQNLTFKNLFEYLFSTADGQG